MASMVSATSRSYALALVSSLHVNRTHRPNMLLPPRSRDAMLALHVPHQYVKSHVLIVRAYDPEYAQRWCEAVTGRNPARSHATHSIRTTRPARPRNHLPRHSRAHQHRPSRPPPLTP